MNLCGRFGVAVVVFAVGGIVTAQNLSSQAFYVTEQNSTLQETFDATFTSYQCEGCSCGLEECGCGTCDYCDGYGCNECGSNRCGTSNVLAGGSCGDDCCRQYFAGVDYLYVRANFSEMVAYVEQDDADPFKHQDTFHQQDFQADSSYRLYGGIRDCYSGLEWRLNFTRFNSHAPSITKDASDTTYKFPLSPNLSPGNEITVSAGTRVNSYDIGCAKTILLGSPVCCDPGCGDSCDSCQCGYPTWDFTWEAGVRYADVAWQQDVYSRPPTFEFDTHGLNRMRFEGTGLRFGLGGRRYFGYQGCFSVFLNGDISLLVGDVEITSILHSVDSTTTAKSTQQLVVRNVIPVTEIEAGVTGQITHGMSLSAGYMFSAWHDLGVRQEFFPQDQEVELGISAFDDANILAFDGFFARLEAEF